MGSSLGRCSDALRLGLHRRSSFRRASPPARRRENRRRSWWRRTCRTVQPCRQFWSGKRSVPGEGGTARREVAHVRAVRPAPQERCALLLWPRASHTRAVRVDGWMSLGVERKLLQGVCTPCDSLHACRTPLERDRPHVRGRYRAGLVPDGRGFAQKGRLTAGLKNVRGSAETLPSSPRAKARPCRCLPMTSDREL